MFEAFGGARWWPLNSQVAVVRADADRLVEQAYDHNGRAIRACYSDLEEAVAARAPYPCSRRDTDFLVPTADGATVVLSSGEPSIGGSPLGFITSWVPCDAVAVGWHPRHRFGLAGAYFDDYRHTPPRPPAPGPRDTDQLSLQVSDQGSGWVFDRIPPGRDCRARPYEEPEVYRARIKADRLPFDLLARYLAAVGVPVHDPGYLVGPVRTVSTPRRIPAEWTWSTVAQLRLAAGYPPSGIVTDLRAKPRLD